VTQATQPEAGLRHDDERIIGEWRDSTARRFVRWVMLATAGLLVAVLGVNALVDPYGAIGTGIFPSVIPEDSSAKVQLLQALDQPPEFVVLGSSRAMRIEPSYIRGKTGIRGFNAAVRSGTPLDAWAFANFIHDHWTGSQQKYLWMLDVNAFQYQSPKIHENLFRTPELSPYFPSADRAGLTASDVLDLLSWRATRDSFKSVRAKIRGVPPVVREDKRAPGEYSADGGRLVGDFGSPGVSNDAGLGVRIKATPEAAQAAYAGPALSDQPRRYFERTLAAMNRWGASPVLVLTPIHPRLHQIAGPLGWDARHRAVLDYLDRLSSRFRLTVIDLTSIDSFGGSPDDFYDGTHMKTPNLHLMLDEVLRQAPNLS
jgi:hypothetical protein